MDLFCRSYSILFNLPIADRQLRMLKLCGDYILLATKFEKPVQAVFDFSAIGTSEIAVKISETKENTYLSSSFRIRGAGKRARSTRASG